MHPCLSVDEIVRLVAHELVASEGKVTAVALACCCKIFEDPVLDALWETQKRLLPLLKSLPGDVWDEDECKSFKRLPTATEWARFRNYARRMQELSEYAFTNLDLPPSQVLSVLQFRTLGGPLLPNLKSLELRPTENSLSFIPLFLSPTTTAIDLILGGFSHPTAVIASMVTTFPTLCPNLQEIRLNSLPRDPMITAAISELLLATNRDALRSFHVDSPLTEDAREVVFKLPDLRELRVVINEADSLPTLVLPNLTEIDIEYDHDCGWLQGFRGATLGKLASVSFRSESHSIDGFLEAFESVALTTSIPATLLNFTFYTSHSWRPNYRSLLPFTQLKELVVDFSCGPDCSSTIDDDTIIDLAQAMPMLEILHLGEQPCQTPGGITAKGLAAIAHYCLHLSELRIHFQVASLNPPEIPAVISDCESTAPWVDCALTTLEVGDIRVPKKASLMVALTLVRIFPRLSVIYWRDEGWEKVEDALSHSKQFVSWSRTTLKSAIRS